MTFRFFFFKRSPGAPNRRARDGVGGRRPGGGRIRRRAGAPARAGAARARARARWPERERERECGGRWPVGPRVAGRPATLNRAGVSLRDAPARRDCADAGLTREAVAAVARLRAGGTACDSGHAGVTEPPGSHCPGAMHGSPIWRSPYRSNRSRLVRRSPARAARRGRRCSRRRGRSRTPRSCCRCLPQPRSRSPPPCCPRNRSRRTARARCRRRRTALPRLHRSRVGRAGVVLAGGARPRQDPESVLVGGQVVAREARERAPAAVAGRLARVAQPAREGHR